MKLYFGTLILVAVIYSGCSYQKYDDYIIGKWNGVKWETEGQKKSDEITKYWFEFSEDGSYASYFGGLNEKGNFRVEYNRLYTQAEGEAEIVVEILSMTVDTLRIGMNRGGVPETLVLAHQ